MKIFIFLFFLTGSLFVSNIFSKTIPYDPKQLDKSLLEPVSKDEFFRVLEEEVQIEDFLSRPDNLEPDIYLPKYKFKKIINSIVSKNSSYSIVLQNAETKEKLLIISERGKRRLLRNNKVGILIKKGVIFFLDFLNRKKYSYFKAPRKLKKKYMNFYKKYMPLLWLDIINMKAYIDSCYSQDNNYKVYYLFPKIKNTRYALRVFLKEKELKAFDLMLFPERKVLENWKVIKFVKEGKIKFTLKNFK